MELKKRQKISPAKKAKIGGSRWVVLGLFATFFYTNPSPLWLCVYVCNLKGQVGSWSWAAECGRNGEAALRFLPLAYYLILFYLNSSAPSVTLLSLSLSLRLSRSHRTRSLSSARTLSQNAFSGWQVEIGGMKTLQWIV